ncbi:MAG: hypothetical protein H6560_19660 [Lewinellaceae bacterium]|nr:hypothetical protein [Lewinellaceae bacterium]
MRITFPTPHAATLQWEVPVNGGDKMMDVFWYSGGIRPRTPKFLKKEGKGMPQEGVMFVGEKGAILADYGYGNPMLYEAGKASEKAASIPIPEVQLMDQTTEMIRSFKGGKASRGSYPNAQAIAEAICLGNLAIRMDQRLEWDNENLEVTNVPEANEFVRRKCREGWEI